MVCFYFNVRTLQISGTRQWKVLYYNELDEKLVEWLDWKSQKQFDIKYILSTAKRLPGTLIGEHNCNRMIELKIKMEERRKVTPALNVAVLEQQYQEIKIPSLNSSITKSVS